MKREILMIALLACAAFQARADFISLDPQSIPVWADGSTLFFPKFDASLGTLSSVHISESAVVGPLITYFLFPGQSPQNPSVGFGGIASLLGTGPDGHLLGFQRSFGGYAQAPTTADGSVSISGNGEWTYSLDPFIGDDLWALSFNGGYGFLFEDRPPGVGISVFDKQTDLWASITYEYTPALVPEPRMYGVLMGLLLAGTWWRAKKRRA